MGTAYTLLDHRQSSRPDDTTSMDGWRKIQKQLDVRDNFLACRFFPILVILLLSFKLNKSAGMCYGENHLRLEIENRKKSKKERQHRKLIKLELFQIFKSRRQRYLKEL